MRILLVDDSRTLREVAKEFLITNDFEVELAENGAQALDKYVTFKPDAVILDMTMPIMDGNETLKRLLKLDGNARIIMSTATETEEIIEKCLNDGASAFITKPFSEEELVNVVKNTVWYDKHTYTLFYLAGIKIERVIRRIIQSDASIILKHVSAVHQETLPLTLSNNPDLSQIRSVQTFQQVDTIPKGVTCYVNQVYGQRSCKVLSFMEAQYLHKIFENPPQGGVFKVRITQI